MFKVEMPFPRYHVFLRGERENHLMGEEVVPSPCGCPSKLSNCSHSWPGQRQEVVQADSHGVARKE